MAGGKRIHGLLLRALPTARVPATHRQPLGSTSPHLDLAYVHARRARWDEAREEMRRALRLAGLEVGRADSVTAGLGDADSRDRQAALAILSDWAREGEISPALVAWFFTVFDAEDLAVDQLLRAYERRDPNSLDTVVLLRRYRSDPRAARVLRELGFKGTWGI